MYCVGEYTIIISIQKIIFNNEKSSKFEEWPTVTKEVGDYDDGDDTVFCCSLFN